MPMYQSTCPNCNSNYEKNGKNLNYAINFLKLCRRMQNKVFNGHCTNTEEQRSQLLVAHKEANWYMEDDSFATHPDQLMRKLNNAYAAGRSGSMIPEEPAADGGVILAMAIAVVIGPVLLLLLIELVYILILLLEWAI